jgi:hypothetical protein
VYTVTAKIGITSVLGASTTVTVVDASFGAPMIAHQRQKLAIPRTNVSMDLYIQGAESLQLRTINNTTTAYPETSGQKTLIARIGKGGPVVAAGLVNVFYFGNAGDNGGFRTISTFPDGKKLVSMRCSLGGIIPANLKIRVAISTMGSLTPSGHSGIWLEAKDFDESGFADIRFLSYSASCHSYELYLSE